MNFEESLLFKLSRVIEMADKVVMVTLNNKQRPTSLNIITNFGKAYQISITEK